MHIIPAIDLYQGACVRLLKGQFNQVTVYNQSPLAVARDFADQGARELHVVDLEASRRGQSVEKAAVLELVHQTDLKIQLGGGIRTYEMAAAWLKEGIDRVVLGSAAVAEPQLVQRLLADFGPSRCVLALDVKRVDEGEETAQGTPAEAAGPNKKTSKTLDLWFPMSQGWTQEHRERGLLSSLLTQYVTWGGSYLLSTDISRDGALTGPSLSLYRDLLGAFPSLEVIASGGIGCLEDLRDLVTLGVPRVVLGKALYEKKFTLKEAFSAVFPSKKDPFLPQKGGLDNA